MMDMRIVFMGGKQAGCIGILSILAKKHGIAGAVAYDEGVRMLCESLGIPIFASVKEGEFRALAGKSDLLVSVHGREIVPREVMNLPRLGAINAHPCLYKYKGARPVERMLADGETRASVGVHRMTEKLDEGEVLAEIFVDVSGKSTECEVYNALYPFYAAALMQALDSLESNSPGQ